MRAAPDHSASVTRECLVIKHMNDSSLLIWSSAAASHPGKVRKVNEDACLNMPELGLWAVADGIGGHAAGDFASSTVVQHLQCVTPGTDIHQSIQRVQMRLKSANNAILEESQRLNRRIGSTVAVLLVCADTGACIWAGDSRVYRHRAGTLTLLTTDHSIVEQEIAEGRITRTSARKNSTSNAITRAVGPEDDLELDVAFTELQHSDTFAVCSDGLYKELSDDELAAILSQEQITHESAPRSDAEGIVQTLVNAALARGARDNLSVIVVRFANAF